MRCSNSKSTFPQINQFQISSNLNMLLWSPQALQWQQRIGCDEGFNIWILEYDLTI
jgi:hypothetical protein